jgi:copper homeostasis protein
LCAALAIGGLTPSLGLMELAGGCGVPCYPMIRPRSGDFVFSRDEVAVMCADIRAVRATGLTGLVLGASRPDGRLDEAVLGRLIEEAVGLDLTLHRAVDLAPDVEEAVETAIRLGFRRILSSGGARVAVEGVDRLQRMIGVAGGRLSVMPGSGVTVDSWPQLAGLGVSEVHASCASPLIATSKAVEFGFVTGAEKRTDRVRVAALKALIG